MNLINSMLVKRNITLKPMMKSALIAISLVCFSGVTHAQGWTGLYAGPIIGGVFNDAEINSHNLGFTNPNGHCNTSSNFSSFAAGVEGGYAYEFGSNLVLGVEGNFTYNTNQNSRLGCNCPTDTNVGDHFSVKNRQQGSIRGVFGYDLGNNFLPFFKVGGSFANVGLNYSNEIGDYYSKTDTQAGWLVGLGFEWSFAPSWSASAEYNYVAYSNLSLKIPTIYGLNDPNGNANLRLNTNNMKFALNYWFWR